MNSNVVYLNMTPLARRIAAERGIDVSRIRGSGHAGKIYAYDIKNMPMGMAVGGYAPAPGYVAEPGYAEEFGDRPGFAPEYRQEQGFAPDYGAAPEYQFAQGSAPSAPVYIEDYVQTHDRQSAQALERQFAQEHGAAPSGIASGDMAAGDMTAEDAAHGSMAHRGGTPAEAALVKAMVTAARTADADVAGVFRMNEARRTVASLTARSAAQTAAVTQHMETDVTELLALRRRMGEDLQSHEQIPLTAFYLKAMAACVREKERFRMRLAEAEDAYLLVEGAHIGLQVGVGDGMATPVIRDADRKSLEDVTAEASLLTEKAKRGGLVDYEMKGGAITLLDKERSGIYAFTPIIKQPEAAIMGIGAAYPRLVMTDRGIENRQFIMQSLTFDHRVINGAEADEFQRRLKEILEDPQSIVG